MWTHPKRVQMANVVASYNKLLLMVIKIEYPTQKECKENLMPNANVWAELKFLSTVSHFYFQKRLYCMVAISAAPSLWILRGVLTCAWNLHLWGESVRFSSSMIRGRNLRVQRWERVCGTTVIFSLSLQPDDENANRLIKYGRNDTGQVHPNQKL